mgnify:CR=1 FL=1|tara:strand:+ start:535 stop:732 length:198 start_codon:yes stop_codon:yes gene_type:complete
MKEQLRIKGCDLEVRYSKSGFWQEDLIVFFSPPSERNKPLIIEYLYEEGFILDPRTPVRILDLNA